MRTPGHSGTHLPGSAFKMALNSQYGKGPATEHMLRSRTESFGPGPFNSRKTKWLIYSAGTLLWFLICFQIFVDVYVLAVR